MSFSGEIKEELSRMAPGARHCLIAELSAIISGCGQVLIDEDDLYSLDIHSENVHLIRRTYMLLKDAFGIQAVISLHKNSYIQKNDIYHLLVSEDEEARKVFYRTGVLLENGEIAPQVEYQQLKLLRRDCCRRAYLRGAFLTTGSISDPEKQYHLEIVCGQQERADVLKQIMEALHMEAKSILRKNNYVVYLKEGEQILEFLGMIGANRHLFAMENVRIVKEVRNQVNRRVNCETANLKKTASASARQMEDIRFILDHKDLLILPANLREVASLRLEYPESSLKELGEMLDPPVGKSGVNHRLRRISEIAEKLRDSLQTQTSDRGEEQITD